MSPTNRKSCARERHLATLPEHRDDITTPSQMALTYLKDVIESWKTSVFARAIMRITYQAFVWVTSPIVWACSLAPKARWCSIGYACPAGRRTYVLGGSTVLLFGSLAIWGSLSFSKSSLHKTEQSRCRQILRPLSGIQDFPLLCVVDESAHIPVIDRIYWLDTKNEISQLHEQRNSIYVGTTKILTESRRVVEHLVIPWHTETALDVETGNPIKSFRKTLLSMADSITISNATYVSLQEIYQGQISNATEELKKYDSNRWHEWGANAIPFQDFSSRIVFGDLDEKIGKPRRQILRTVDEAHLGLTVVDRALRRLQQLSDLVRKLAQLMKALDMLFAHEGAKCNHRCKQELVQQWLRQNVLGNAEFIKIWDEISGSITPGEQWLPIGISDALCDRGEIITQGTGLTSH